MAIFADAEELYRYIGGVFRLGGEDPELGPQFADSGVVLRVTYTDPDAVITVDLPNLAVYTGAGTGPAPNVEMFMSADTGHRFWLGKVNLTFAMAKGQVRARGSLPKILKLVPASKALFPKYADLLRADGREDLLTG